MATLPLKMYKPLLSSRYILNISLRTSVTSVRAQDGISTELKPFSELPGPKGLYKIPYIGSTLLFKPFTNYVPSEIGELLTHLGKNYDGIFKLRMGKDNWVIVDNPNYAKTVLQAKYEDHMRLKLELPIRYNEKNGKPLGLGLRTGKEWAALRKPAQEKMLRPAVVSTYVPLIEKVTNDFVERLRQKDQIDDLLKELSKYTTESVGMLCFNRRLNSFDDNSDETAASLMSTLFECLQYSMFMPVKTFLYYDTKLYRKYSDANERFSKITQKELTLQRNFLRKLKEEGKLEEYLEKDPNFMNSVLSDPRISEEEACSLVHDLFAAGIDSTANSMVFLLDNLARNPNKQEKLYQEIYNIVGSNKSLTKEHLGQMSYLKACLKESMRKTIPGPIGVIRVLESDLLVAGYEIPKSTIVAINMEAMTKDERIYPEPEKFVPERWLRQSTSEISKGQEHPYAMLPFGTGPRSCIGQRFAENEIYIGITKILQNFQISVPSNAREIKPVSKLFTTPSDKVVLNLKQRGTAYT